MFDPDKLTTFSLSTVEQEAKRLSELPVLQGKDFDIAMGVLKALRPLSDAGREQLKMLTEQAVKLKEEDSYTGILFHLDIKSILASND